MALVPCPDCKTPVSSDAPTCPSCGRKKPLDPFRATFAVVLVLTLVGVLWLAWKFDLIKMMGGR